MYDSLMKIEKAGSEVTYRCVDCRSCVKCKSGMRIEAISIQEEIEQGLIEKCVHVDVTQGTTTAKLPFLANADSCLVPNLSVLKVYRGQVEKLSRKVEDKIAVIEFEKKLQMSGFVDYVSNLNETEKTMILSSDVKYFIPWRAVWNEKSLSTPCRMVFDASQGTKNGCSLNSLLAKGANSMNKLVEILIRWTSRPHAFHTDVTKMYNAVKLDKMFWRYQLYLWSNDLAENITPEWKVMKTLIYGVRSSGNLAECGLRRTAELCKDEFPRTFDVITFDTYMDDCMSGAEDAEKTDEVINELQVILKKGGFSLKGFSISRHDLPQNVSSDKNSVLVPRLKWFPKGDFIKLNISELNFNKKFRGRKLKENIGVIPDFLTKRDCVSKVSEVFDPLGKVATIIGGMKLDISILHQRCIKWDDPIPNELKNIWIQNFNLIEEIGEIKFNRAIVPPDALNLNIETIDTADASENLICAAVHARFKRLDGTHSCQLIFSRTKIIHDVTVPRAELMAAVLNASTGHVISKSLKNLHKKHWKITDSQVALHWIACTKSTLKPWVRNRVVEVARLSDRANWWYVQSDNMIADLGTRKGAKVTDIGPGSFWINGYPWMSDEENNFPLKTINEIVLSNQEKRACDKEKVLESTRYTDNNLALITRYVPNEVGERYKFSKYLINPNKFRFRTIIRILGIVILFIQKISKNCKKSQEFGFMKNQSFVTDWGQLTQTKGEYVVSLLENNSNSKPNTMAVLHLPDEILNAAKGHFFRKAALVVKEFVAPFKYEHKSAWKDVILFYTGRILPTQEIEGKISLSDVCLDLASSTFCVPITDAFSPIAYAIVTETHWYDPNVKHGGIESVLRYCQNTAYVIGGRALVKSVKRGCAKCRILHKKGVSVAMGPIGENNLNIAPPFYFCQIDLCGPFNAYSPVNKRASLKIWFLVSCCTVTGAVDCRVMENYTTDAFILAFIRFTCRFGYPKRVPPDEGSQLVEGCQDMKFSFTDIQNRLYIEYGIEFKTCPVGAHYVHGKVERKIQNVKKCIRKNVDKSRLSILQWETLGQQISNSINNMPVGLGNKSDLLENADILTPNRLILGRNNNRNPTLPLEISHDYRGIIRSNKEILNTWFKEWLISYVPNLVDKPKWFLPERNISVGDVVLFLKSEKEFNLQYQYGMVHTVIMSRDSIVRTVEI